MGRYVYNFAPGKADGSAAMTELLGAKGAGLAEMSRLGISVPPGMTITTEACAHYLRTGAHPAQLVREVRTGIGRIEALTERGWGDEQMPLLLSVRAGGPESMPGMTETVLNLGLNDETALGLGNAGEEWFVLDCRRRMLQMYSRVVFGVDERLFRSQSEEVGPGDLAAMEEIIRREAGTSVPEEPDCQLWRVIEAIFKSWKSSQMASYRRLHGIDSGPGIAVNIMAMVFGNRDDQSASGIGFTRNPATGNRRHYGEYLSRAQGNEVVGGEVTPAPVQEVDRVSDDTESLQAMMPVIHGELSEVLDRLERHYKDMQEIEFTIESGRLWLLQTRRATRTGPAAVNVALDMIDEGLINDEESVMRVDPRRHAPKLLYCRVDFSARESAQQSGTEQQQTEKQDEPLCRGVAASPGAATGRLVTNSAEAVERARRGESVVLVCSMTSTEDVDGLRAAAAVVTSEGGLTAHAAEVAREVGLPCVCGAWPMVVADDGSGIEVGDRFISRGELVTVDGNGGQLFVGKLPLIGAGDDDERLNQFLEVVDRYRRMDVRVVADTLEEVDAGVALGADGIGMCRIEEMIFGDDDRVMAMRRVLFADDEQEGEDAIHQLLRFHRHDLAQIVRVADGRPLTVRLLDAPLNQFLPDDEADLVRTANTLEMEVDDIRRQAAALEESNPMLGLRGCRLAVVHPSIYAMQVQAIVEAARMVVDEGVVPHIEILLPRVAEVSELQRVVELVEQTIAENLHGATERITIDIGALIQLPRAALACEEIGSHVDFIVLATAELTRLCWGMSSDDAGRFMTTYLDERILSHDPFQSIDREGVGELIRLATGRGRTKHRGLLVGVDSGHGADPRSIRFFETLDIDYLTVRPQDVPATRLAAARAYIAYERSLQDWLGTGEVER